MALVLLALAGTSSAGASPNDVMDGALPPGNLDELSASTVRQPCIQSYFLEILIRLIAVQVGTDVPNIGLYSPGSMTSSTNIIGSTVGPSDNVDLFGRSCGGDGGNGGDGGSGGGGGPDPARAIEGLVQRLGNILSCTEEQSSSGPDGTEYRQRHCPLESRPGGRIAIGCSYTETENPDVTTRSSACVFTYNPQTGPCFYEYSWDEEPDNEDRPDKTGCGPE